MLTSPVYKMSFMLHEVRIAWRRCSLLYGLVGEAGGRQAGGGCVGGGVMSYARKVMQVMETVPRINVSASRFLARPPG